MLPKFRKAERDVYHKHLVLGGENAAKHGMQPRFAELVESNLPKGEEFNHASLGRVIEAASEKADAPLRHQLERIRDIEGLLVASANLFGFLQHRDRCKIGDVVRELRGEWGKGLGHIRDAAIADMGTDLSRILDDSTAGSRLVALATALRTGSWEDAVNLTLEHNKFVMNTRNGSQPWIQRSLDTIDVLYRDDSHPRLANPEDLARTWRSTFYLNPLKMVSDQLKGAR